MVTSVTDPVQPAVVMSDVVPPAVVPPEVVCAGILVADLFVPPLPRLPEPGELLATEDFLTDSGGCAANVATCLAILGVRAGIAGKVGHDSFGDFIAQDLQRKGVETRGLTRSRAHGTSKTVILPVVGADRRYIHTIGANADLTARDFDRTVLAGTRVLYLGGYLVLPGLTQRELSGLLRFARAQGLRTVLDIVVPATGARPSLDALVDILPHVDVFLPNDEEAQVLTGEHEPRRQAARFLAAGCNGAIITRGEHGALFLSAEQILETSPVPVETIDPSGAGDAFAAGVIVGLLEGWSMQASLDFASLLGAAACTRLGCTAGVPTRGQAEAYLRAYPRSADRAAAPLPAAFDRLADPVQMPG